MRKNELEMLLMCCKKAITKVVEENPKAGVIFNKGEPNETRMRYSEALKAINKLDAYFGLQARMSFGICQDCTKWNTSEYSSGYCGSCRIGQKAKQYHVDILHAYDTCDLHSKKGGGYGL